MARGLVMYSNGKVWHSEGGEALWSAKAQFCYDEQRHSFVVMSKGIGLFSAQRLATLWLGLVQLSEGKAWLCIVALCEGKAGLGCAKPCEGKVMRDAAVQWLCIVALCEGNGEVRPGYVN